MKNVGMHLVCYFPYYSCLCTFFALPSLLTLIIFILVTVTFFIHDFESPEYEESNANSADVHTSIIEGQ